MVLYRALLGNSIILLSQIGYSKVNLTLLLEGRRSGHRVTLIGQTRQPRLNILYTYNEWPSMVFSKASQKEKRNQATDQTSVWRLRNNSNNQANLLMLP